MRRPIGRMGIMAILAILGAAMVVTGALAAPSAQASATVQVAQNAKFGSILVDAKGMTLYTLSSEAGGKIQCTGACLSTWPPVLLPAGTTAPTAGTGVTGTLGVVTRPEGGTQVTYNGFPLYTFAGDQAAGDTNGEGIPDPPGVWHVVQVAAASATTATPAPTSAPASSGGPQIQTAGNASLGTILVNSAGFTLYYNTAEVNSHIVCSGKCLGVWPPVDLPAGTTAPTVASGVTGTVGSFKRPEGDQQVTYNGFPLYTFAKDKAPGDTHGNGINALGGVWIAARAQSVPLSASLAARLTIHITRASGFVWGKVAVTYTANGRRVQQTCSAATCRLGVPLGVAIHLTQTPANAGTWPFQAWRVKTAGGHTRTSLRSALRLTMAGDSTVSTIYREG
jgi:predicted lipoprotein with Yx(FWY)xxD motif